MDEEAKKKMTGRDAFETLDELIREHGRPEFIRADNGSEFIAKELRKWLSDQGVQPVYFEPGRPWQNRYIECFIGKLRDECVNQELFPSKAEARAVVGWWRQVYNWERPHRGLKGKTPGEARSSWSGPN